MAMKNKCQFGSLLLSIGNGQIEFTDSKVKHGDEIFGGKVTAGLTFHGVAFVDHLTQESIISFEKSYSQYLLSR